MRIAIDCKTCGKQFEKRTKWQRFCSSACKQRAYRVPCEKCGVLRVPSAKTCMKCRPSRWKHPEFWSLVIKTEYCWLWQGPCFKDNGYGRAFHDGHRQPAHRVAWELTNGPIPDGLFACHHCDVKPCVRPSHLFLGTQKDNMQDWTKKGKNRLVSDPSLRKYGDANWMRQNRSLVFRGQLSRRLRNEIKSGERTILRDAKSGQLLGTRKIKFAS